MENMRGKVLPPTEIKKTLPPFPETAKGGRPPQFRLLLFLLLILSFYGLGKWVGGLGAVPSSRSGEVATPTPLPASGENLGGKTVLAGTIVPLGVVEGEEGTHKLVDDKGQILAILVSRKLDLNFTVPGVTVEVSGQVVKWLEDGKPLLRVESLKYRRTDEEKL